MSCAVAASSSRFKQALADGDVHAQRRVVDLDVNQQEGVACMLGALW